METSKGVYEVMAECEVLETVQKHWWWPFNPKVKFYNSWVYLGDYGKPRYLYIHLKNTRTFASVEEALAWVKDLRVGYPLEVMEIDKDLYSTTSFKKV